METLAWQDNFQSEKYLKENWVIDDESCSEWKYCGVKENVKLLNECLVMNVKEDKYSIMNFSGAQLTTKRVFGYGRFEARTALSVDRIVWSLFSTKPDDWEKDGHFKMLDFDHVSKSRYGALFPNKIDKINQVDIDYSSFHLYGMECSENEVIFFVDDHYSEPIP